MFDFCLRSLLVGRRTKTTTCERFDKRSKTKADPFSPSLLFSPSFRSLLRSLSAGIHFLSTSSGGRYFCFFFFFFFLPPKKNQKQNTTCCCSSSSLYILYIQKYLISFYVLLFIILFSQKSKERAFHCHILEIHTTILQEPWNVFFFFRSLSHRSITA